MSDGEGKQEECDMTVSGYRGGDNGGVSQTLRN